MEKMKKKIVIGDDAFYAQGMKDALEYEGYEVILEPHVTGERVLELVRDADLAIVDIQISHTGTFIEDSAGEDVFRYPGIVFCQELKRRDPSFPVICMAMTENDQIDQQLLDAGCIVIYKASVDIEGVLGIIKKALA